MSVAAVAVSDVAGRKRTASEGEVVAILDKIDRSKDAFFKMQPQSHVCSKKLVVTRYMIIGGIAGAGVGAGVGTAVPGIGTSIGAGAGGFIGMGIGAVYGVCKAHITMEGEYQKWLSRQSEETRQQLLNVMTRSGKFEFAECSISHDTCWIPLRSLIEPTILVDRGQLREFWRMNGMFHPGLLGGSTPVVETDFVVAYDVMIQMNHLIGHMLENVGDLELTAKQREGLEILRKDQDRFLTHCFETEKEALDKIYKERKAKEGESVKLVLWYAECLGQLSQAFKAHQ